MPGPFATVIVQRISSLSEAGQETRHGLRQGEMPHVDPTRIHLNRFGSDIKEVDPTDVVACIKAATAAAGAKTRKGASVAFSAMCVASPEFFRPDNTEAAGTWREDRLEPWLDLNLKVLRARFGPIAAWRLDLDEATPHLIAVFVPTSVRTTKTGKTKVEVSVRDAVGGWSGKATELQDWYAGAMGPLGLQRGIPKSETGRERKPVRQMHQEMAADRAAAAQLKAEADAALKLSAETRAQAQLDVAIARKAAEADRKEAARLKVELANVVRQAREAALEAAMLVVRPVLQFMEGLKKDAPAIVDAVAQQPEPVRAAAEPALQRLADWFEVRLPAAFKAVGAPIELESLSEPAARSLIRRSLKQSLKSSMPQKTPKIPTPSTQVEVSPNQAKPLVDRRAR